MTFLDSANVGRVPPNSKIFEGVKLWLEEGIFGHRLWARQTPWLLFLEFLNVAEALYREGSLLQQTTPEQTIPHMLRWRMGLRNVLFNNDELSRLADERHDDETSWSEWLASMERTEAAPAEGFGYVRERFQRFEDFAEVVSLVRQTALEAASNRRWSSRFIFPFGVDAIYSDAIVKQDRPTRDYNNFGRTGELLYLMLTRARDAEALRPYIERFLEPARPKNRLVALISAPSDARPTLDMRGNSFLPYRAHPAFDRLLGDWLAVLRLDLPDQDSFAYLAPLATLHVLLYQLETAAAVVGKARPSLICEIIAPHRELVRQRSIASYHDNDALSRQAVAARLIQFFEGTDWARTRDGELPENEQNDIALDLLRREFSFTPRESSARSPEALEAHLQQAADTKHDENWSQVHSAYGRYVGLVSRRGTNRNRYAPTDTLLKLLVITRVRKRAEFGKFLADLYQHYGLVFGPVEAAASLPATSFDESTFSRNRERLEGRLSSMGLLKRLSDGCAYVLNPFDRPSV